MGMAEPFAEDFPGMLHTQVYPMMNPSVHNALSSMGQLAHTLRDTAAGVLAAVIDAQKEHTHEVAVAVLLSGTATIMGAHRRCFHAIGTHMSTAVAAITIAWSRYGSTGTWTIPDNLKPPPQPDTHTAITLAAPRPLTMDESIDPNYTQTFIDHVRNAGDRFATVSANTFTKFACHDLPVGELSEAIDITDVEHTAAIAHTATTMQQHLHHLTNIIETSHRQYLDTRLWAAPTITATS